MKKLAICAFFIYSVMCLVSYAEGGDAGINKPDNPKAKPSLTAPIAPDFALKDLSGKTRFLKDYRGKVVFLYFTTTWCPYCKRDMPNLKKLYSSMKGKNFEFFAIYINESHQKVAAFAEKYALPFPILLDSEATVARSYGVRGVPSKILVRKDGTIGCWQCINVEEGIEEFLKEV